MWHGGTSPFVPGDIVVVECEGKEIRDHSLVASARSTVFAKTLETDIKERREKTREGKLLLMPGEAQHIEVLQLVQWKQVWSFIKYEK